MPDELFELPSEPEKRDMSKDEGGFLKEIYQNQNGKPKQEKIRC